MSTFPNTEPRVVTYLEINMMADGYIWVARHTQKYAACGILIKDPYFIAFSYILNFFYRNGSCVLSEGRYYMPYNDLVNWIMFDGINECEHSTLYLIITYYVMILLYFC